MGHPKVTRSPCTCIHAGRTHMQVQGCHDPSHDVITPGVDDQRGPLVQGRPLEVHNHEPSPARYKRQTTYVAIRVCVEHAENQSTASQREA
jgi:hypothetical protein